MEALAQHSVNEDPVNPFRPLAAEGYAWALLGDVADRSPLSSTLVAKLLKAQTWMDNAGLRTTLGNRGNSFAQTCSYVSRTRDGLLDFRTPGNTSFLRLNPKRFVHEREKMLGGNLEPAIARTITLARLRHQKTSLHPVLDRADELFSTMDRCFRRRGFPVGQQVGFLMTALSGERGFTPHTFTTPHAANQGAMRVMMDKFQRPGLPKLNDGFHLANFFTQQITGKGKSARVRYTPTPELVEFLGGQEAINDLKARVLDADGTFPLPIHGMSADELRTLGQTFMAERERNLPPSEDVPPPAMEKYGLDPSRTYTITLESEQQGLQRRTYLNPGLRGLPFTVLTPQSDFGPYIITILRKLQLSPADPENVDMVRSLLKEPDGPARVFGLFSSAVTDPCEEVLVGYQQGGSRAGITVVKAAVLVPLND